MYRRHVILSLILFVEAAIVCAPCQAQGLGSRLTAISLAQAGGVRLLGMGGTAATVSDEGNIRNASTLTLLESLTE